MLTDEIRNRFQGRYGVSLDDVRDMSPEDMRGALGGRDELGNKDLDDTVEMIRKVKAEEKVDEDLDRIINFGCNLYCAVASVFN